MSTPVVKPVPIEVAIVGNTSSREYAPELAAWSSWTLTGNESGSGAFQILPQDARRFKAIISCLCTGDVGYVLIGKRDQVMNGQGFILAGGNEIPVESQAAVWMAAGGTAITVSVLDQRYTK